MERTLTRRRCARGFSLIELTITLMIVAGVTLVLMRQILQHVADRQQAVAASQMAAYADALQHYVATNAGTLSTCASTTTPCAVTFAQLQAGGFLPNTFNASNIYGQSYLSAVLKDGNGNLLPLAVTTGGNVIPDNDVRTVAAKITQNGGQGGFISIQAPGTAQGAFGSWGNGLSVSSWGFNPGGGHIADALFMHNAAIADDYLHRHATPGQPQLNQMSTAIDMNGNDINNGNNITAKLLTFPAGGNAINIGGSYLYGDSSNLATRSPTGGLYIQSTSGASGNINQVHNIAGDSGSTFTAQFVSAATGLFANNYVNTNGSMQAGGSINAGGDVVANNSVYASNWFRSYGNTGWYSQTYGGGWYMADTSWIRAYNDKNIYTGGQVQAGTVQSNGRLSTGEYAQIGGKAAPGGGCSPNGLIAQASDGTGMLQCKGGIWVGMGGISRVVNVNGASTCSYGSNGNSNYTYCPAGYKALNAGHQLLYYNNGGNWWMANNGPDTQYILSDGSGAFMQMGGSAGYTCVQQVVTCGQ